MKKSLVFCSILGVLMCSGCFKHREAPHRPVTATSVADAVAKKDTVERLNLSGQAIGALPQELAAMPKLSILLLRNGSGVTSLAVLPSLKALKTLDLSAVKVTDVPAEVFASAGLEQLYLAENGMATLAPAIGGLKGLTYLNLDRNQLTALPAALGDLAGLRWLRLNENKLTALPPELSKLTNLQNLYLRQNKLTAVPECLKGLASLEDVSLSGNQITEVPQWMAELPKLRQLDFDGCPIAKLPEKLDGWKKLHVLSLVHCSIAGTEKARLRAALPDTHIAF